MKILIAEDEYITRLMIQVSLEKWGYRVDCVSNGREAWEALQKPDAPQIAILDWEMPDMDGVEVCRRVKELERETPIYIVLLTGRDSRNDILHGFDMGADDYMTKPFDDNELRARVRVAERLVHIQISLAESVEELRYVLDQMESLQGTLPVCTGCQKIKGGDDAWISLDEALHDESEHRLLPMQCPECMGKARRP
ncbi:MAG: response regulator transcription factor [Desulfocapsaceae bacterium]|nr:response regulator transcription factor [Desulfocapsaceae bacterium]